MRKVSSGDNASRIWRAFGRILAGLRRNRRGSLAVRSVDRFKPEGLRRASERQRPLITRIWYNAALEYGAVWPGIRPIEGCAARITVKMFVPVAAETGQVDGSWVNVCSLEWKPCACMCVFFFVELRELSGKKISAGGNPPKKRLICTMQVKCHCAKLQVRIAGQPEIRFSFSHCKKPLILTSSTNSRLI